MDPYSTAAGGAAEEITLGSLRVPLLRSDKSSKTARTEDSDSGSDSGSDSDSDADAAETAIAVTDAEESPPVLSTVLTVLLTLSGVAAAALAMRSAPTVSVFVAGGACVCWAPWVIVQRVRMAAGRGTQRRVDRIWERLTSIRGEVEVTKANVDDLREEAEGLRDAERALDGIAREQGRSRDDIVSLVRESEFILKQMKERLRLVAMAETTRLLLASDGGGGAGIDLTELNELTIRITLALEMRGIELDGDAFVAMVRKDNNVSRVLKDVGAMMFGVTAEGIPVDEHAAEAPARARRDGRSPAPAPATAAGPLQWTHGHPGRTGRPPPPAGSQGAAGAPMFAVQDRLTQGSVAAARGRRVSLAATPPGPGSRKGRPRTARAAREGPVARTEAGGESHGSEDLGDESLPSCAVRDSVDDDEMSFSSSASASASTSSVSMHLTYS